jgi:hypothetical protein
MKLKVTPVCGRGLFVGETNCAVLLLDPSLIVFPVGTRSRDLQSVQL